MEKSTWIKNTIYTNNMIIGSNSFIQNMQPRSNVDKNTEPL